MLSVRRGKDAVAFYEAAFDARVLFRLDGEDGSLVAQFSLGKSQFWIADESPGHKNFSPETLGGATTRMVLVVDYTDGAFARRISAGSTQVVPLTAQPCRWRVARVVDPRGHHWE